MLSDGYRMTETYKDLLKFEALMLEITWFSAIADLDCLNWGFIG